MSKFKFVQWYGIVVCLLMAACTDVDIKVPVQKFRDEFKSLNVMHDDSRIASHR